jgi:hypothetical protein
MTTMWFEFENKTPLEEFGLDLTEARVFKQGTSTIVEYINDNKEVQIYKITAKQVQTKMFKTFEQYLNNDYHFIETYKGLKMWGTNN